MTEAQYKSIQTAEVSEQVVALKPNQLKVLRWRALGYSHEQIAANFQDQLEFEYFPGFEYSADQIKRDTIRAITNSTRKAFDCHDEVSAVLKAIEQGSLVLDDPKDPIVTPEQVALVDHLSDRERQVLEEMLTGASNIEIAQRLRISPSTVKNHMTHIGEVLQTSLDTGTNRVRKAVLYYAWKQLHREVGEDWFEEADFDAVAAIDTMLTDGVGVIVSRPNLVEGTEPKAIVIASAKSRRELLELLIKHNAVGLGRNIGRPDALHFAKDNATMYAVVTIDSTQGHEILTSDVQEIIRQALVDASASDQPEWDKLSLEALRRLHKLRRE